MPTYYTQYGQIIRNPDAYARTGAPMYTTRYTESKDINAPTAIYKMNLEGGKKYVGKTTDVDRRMDQHFSGNGAKVTKKFKPINAKVVDEVPGFFSDDVEQEYTEEYIDKYGYENVRGGMYTNSKTLKKNDQGSYHSNMGFHTMWNPGTPKPKKSKPKKKVSKCSRCGRSGHSKDKCYAKSHVNGYQLHEWWGR